MYHGDSQPYGSIVNILTSASLSRGLIGGASLGSGFGGWNALLLKNTFFLKQCFLILLVPVRQVLSICGCKLNFFIWSFSNMFLWNTLCRLQSVNIGWRLNALMWRVSCLSREHCASFSPVVTQTEAAAIGHKIERKIFGNQLLHVTLMSYIIITAELDKIRQNTHI